jgi:hypothetical protein
MYMGGREASMDERMNKDSKECLDKGVAWCMPFEATQKTHLTKHHSHVRSAKDGGDDDTNY